MNFLLVRSFLQKVMLHKKTNLSVTFTNGKLEKTLQITADLISLIKEVFR